jgi:hypothetical protein
MAAAGGRQGPGWGAAQIDKHDARARTRHLHEDERLADHRGPMRIRCHCVMLCGLSGFCRVMSLSREFAAMIGPQPIQSFGHHRLRGFAELVECYALARQGPADRRRSRGAAKRPPMDTEKGPGLACPGSP